MVLSQCVVIIIRFDYQLLLLLSCVCLFKKLNSEQGLYVDDQTVYIHRAQEHLQFQLRTLNLQQIDTGAWLDFYV